MNTSFRLFFILNISLFFLNGLKAQFGGGEGTIFNPFWIQNATHLNNIKMTDDDGNYLYFNHAFIQLANIDLGIAPFNEDFGWEPIGDINHPFQGTFDGNEYSIDNLFINRPMEDSIGLFGVTSGADLIDIKLNNVSVTGNNFVGALAGSFRYSGINESDWNRVLTYSSGMVSGNHHTGGLIGCSDHAHIRQSYSTCNVNGADHVGGLIGNANESEVVDCFTLCSVIGNGYNVGGMIGLSDVCEITDCFADCTVEMDGYGSQTGGLVGYLYDNSSITNCYALGAVNGEGTIGGLTGYNHGSEIINSYAACNITGSGAYVGGLAGRSDGTITNSYWDVDISGIIEPGPGDGRTTEEMTYPYAENTYEEWNFIISWVEDPDIGFGHYNSGYPYLKWQFNPQQYGFAGGSGTEDDPFLISTAAHLNSVRLHKNAWFLQIADIDLGTSPWNEGEGWKPIGDNSGTGKFTGQYDGAHYSISNLTINNSSDYNGLFGSIQNASIYRVSLTDLQISGRDWQGGLSGKCDNTSVSGCVISGILSGRFYTGGLSGEIFNTTVISNCTTDVDISGSEYSGGLSAQSDNAEITSCLIYGDVSVTGNYAGGLLAYAINSAISKCSNIGTVSGSTMIGGLVGIQSESSVDQCFTTGNVNGGQFTGGLVGFNWINSAISNSYSSAHVVGPSNYLGGLAGYNPSGNSIINCFSSGLVEGLSISQGLIGIGGGTVNNCFWDVEASGNNTSSGGGTGKTTLEMKTLANYTDDTTPGLISSWDFSGNPFDDDGDEEIWDFDGVFNSGYPYLQWQKRRIIWDGSESSDPLVAENWNNNALPLPTDNILIPLVGSNSLVVNNPHSSPLIYNALFIQSGASMIINPGRALTLNGYIHNEGTLLLESDETGLASLINNPDLSIYGNATVRQYLTSGRWHLVSPPVSNAQIASYLDIYLKEFNEPSNSWTYLYNPVTLPMNTTQGYSAWASDDLTGSTEVDFTGPLNTGDFEIPSLSFTEGSDAEGWNLLGNPYPSSLQWNSEWGKIDVSEWACIHSNGNDVCYNAATNTEWPNPGDMPDGVIPPTQGFWVRAVSPDASVTIPHNHRVHGSHELYKKTATEISSAIRLRVDGNNGYDVALIQFIPDASTGFDPSYDLEKRWSYSSFPQLYSFVGKDDYYSVNALPGVYNEMSISLGFETSSSGIFTLKVAELYGFEEPLHIWLKDLKEGSLTKLLKSTSYSFTAESGENNHRFDLLFSEEYQGFTIAEDNFSVYFSGDNMIVETDGFLKGDISVYNIFGEKIINNIPINDDRMVLSPTGSNGCYIVAISNPSGTISRKIINPKKK